MNKEEEGFVILIQSESAGRLLHNSMKIDESLYSLATAHCDVIYSPASWSYRQTKIYTHFFFSITSSEVLWHMQSIMALC